MSTDNIILQSFWHRTRRVFVPLTAREVSSRTGLSYANARWRLNMLQSRNMVTGEQCGDGNVTAFYITSAGKGLLRKSTAEAYQ